MLQADKQDKDDVSYSVASSADESCQECRNYTGGACELVKGQISPGYWCSLFDALIDA